MILEAEAISKKYLTKQALKDVSISLEQGRIAGLFGPNGSGKTTFLKIVAGLIQPSGGRITVCGSNIGHITKGKVAFLPDSEFLYDWMRIKDAGNTYARFYRDFNLKKFEDLLEFMLLDKDSKVKSLSRGMKEKLALSLTLSREAKLFVLDEPLNGVDPIAREQIIGAILKGFSEDSAMLISSHMINELENIIDEVYYLKEGTVTLCGNVEELKEERHKTLDELFREVFA